MLRQSPLAMAVQSQSAHLGLSWAAVFSSRPPVALVAVNFGKQMGTPQAVSRTSIPLYYLLRHLGEVSLFNLALDLDLGVRVEQSFGKPMASPPAELPALPACSAGQPLAIISSTRQTIPSAGAAVVIFGKPMALRAAVSLISAQTSSMSQLLLAAACF